MLRIIDTITDSVDHLALDEAVLIDGCESIRVWEFSTPIVVAGRATRVDEEIDRSYCQANRIEIVRRCTGGAAVVGGPGCLMYSVVLSTEQNPALRRIDVAHRHVMTRVLAALRQQLPEAQWQGTCDLTYQNRKCSGNSLRISRHHLLYHGTVLYDFDLPLIQRCLRTPPRQPDYRAQRTHGEFVINAPIHASQLAADLCQAFLAGSPTSGDRWREAIHFLRQTRYGDPAWHFRH